MLNTKMCHLDPLTRKNLLSQLLGMQSVDSLHHQPLHGFPQLQTATLPKVMPRDGESGAYLMTGEYKGSAFSAQHNTTCANGWAICAWASPWGWLRLNGTCPTVWFLSHPASFSSHRCSYRGHSLINILHIQFCLKSLLFTPTCVTPSFYSL